MTKRFSAPFGACLLLAACADPVAPSDSGAGDGTKPRAAAFAMGDATRIVEAGSAGVQLGWGWNSLTDTPVPNLCIEFSENSHLAQERSVTIREVTDQSDLMQELDMTASMSVNAIGASVSGKASFAKNIKVNSFQSTYVLDGRVDNGIVFVGPKPSLPDEIARAEAAVPENANRPSWPSGSVRLTEAARALAKNNPATFRRQCGDSYVASIFSGARLYAVITYATRSQSERRKISAEISASGWGASADASANSASSKASVSSDQSIRVFQSGGRGGVIEVDKAGIAKMLQQLPESAASAGKITRLSVIPYQQLPDWPGGEMAPSAAELEQVVDLWGAYRTLYNDIQVALDEPGLFELTASTSYPKLEELQDAVLQIVRDLEAVAAACAADEASCVIDENAVPDPYYYAIRLPLSTDHHKAAAEAFQAKFARQLERRTGNYLDGSKIRAEYDRFLTEFKRRAPNYTLKQFESAIYEQFAKHQEADLALAWSRTRATEDFHKILAADVYVRSRAAQKCLVAANEFGCLENEEVNRFEDLIERDLNLAIQFPPRQLAANGQCLTVSPDASVALAPCADGAASQGFALTVSRRLVQDGRCLALGDGGLRLDPCDDGEAEVWAVVEDDDEPNRVQLRNGIRRAQCLMLREGTVTTAGVGSDPCQINEIRWDAL